MELGELVTGTLQRRYKRFLADVELDDGRLITAHCPNTGAMTGCAEPGSRVWLSISDSPTRKYPHTWELVETRNGLACIHSARANAVVQEALDKELLPELAGYSRIRREVKYGNGSRADLVLEADAGQVVIEVKSVTLCRDGGWGAFPDAVSDRGRKHLQELMAVRDASTRAVMLFCVFHDGIERVCAARDIDPRYAQALQEALDAGVEVLACKASISPRRIVLDLILPFSVDP